MIVVKSWRYGATAIVAFATLLASSACTAEKPATSGPTVASPSSSSLGTSSTPLNSANSSSPVASKSPLESSSAVPTFGPDSITVLSQETIRGKYGKAESLRVLAPVDTRFKIGVGTSADDAISCESKVLSKNPVLYQVTCPYQGPGNKLFSTITYGEFDYGFAKKIR